MPTLSLPEGVHVEHPDGEPVGAALPKGTIAARVDGKRDLSYTPDDDADVEPISPHPDDGLHVLRPPRTCSRRPSATCIRGEVRHRAGVADGFYYDFRASRTGARRRPREDRPSDAADREAEPTLRPRGGLARRGHRAPARSAVQGRDHRGVDDPETAGETGAGQVVSLYSNDGWTDLCMGPHVPHTGMLGAFKLTNVAGAYWRGDERNPQLTRIYGTAWATQDDLDAYLHRLEEAERRDHRKVRTSTCSRSPRRSGRDSPCSTPRAGSCDG